MTSRLELSVPAVSISVRQARDEVAEITARLGAGERTVEDVRLCVSEAVANVVRHAYRSDEGSVYVSVEHDDCELTVAVRDEGTGLSEFRRDGGVGYGLRIIDQLTRRYTICSAPARGTEVRMVFRLEPADRRPARPASTARRSPTHAR